MVKKIGESMKTVTSKGLALMLSVDYLTANLLLKYMVKVGVAEAIGTKQSSPSLSGKGKRATVYQIPDSFTIHFADHFVKVED